MKDHFLVVAPKSWGLSLYESAALKMAEMSAEEPLTKYVIYKAEKGTFIDILGNIVYSKTPPEEIKGNYILDSRKG